MSQLHPISGCDNSERKADVIFLHGLGGDAFGTWRHGKDDSTSWPHWLGGEFPGVGVWSLGYAASASKWPCVLGWFSERWRDAGHIMSLPDRAGQVLDLMAQKDIGGRPILFHHPSPRAGHRAMPTTPPHGKKLLFPFSSTRTRVTRVENTSFSRSAPSSSDHTTTL